jgi:hypothetical protein
MDSAEVLSPSDVATARPAKIVYLDQNKWIDLARAVAAPEDHPEDRTLLEFLCEKVEAGQIRLPLTASNLYETHKLNDPEQRFNLAYTQATLGRAEVFRGHRRRLEMEAAHVLSKLYQMEWTAPDPDWVFSTLFLEAHMEADDPRLETPIPEQILALMRAYPQQAMVDHLAGGPDDIRRAAISKFEAGCEALRVDIEARRIRHGGESESMRRKIYSVLLVVEQQEILIAAADRVGLPWERLKENNGSAIRTLVRETPTLLIEREIALKLEAQARPIHVNDMRDLRNFATLLPYADIIVAENQFTNLARQAGLGDRFCVGLETDLRSLTGLL